MIARMLLLLTVFLLGSCFVAGGQVDCDNRYPFKCDVRGYVRC